MDEIVFLFDVDNTLLDNDGVQADLSDHLLATFGIGARDRYWAIFERLRNELGYVDYFGALERYRLENLHDPRVLALSTWLIDYPFRDRLYPGALDAVAHVARWGRTVVLSDGDAVFQPRKIERSGIGTAFLGRVLIFIHKEQQLDDVERFYPAKRYVLVDDKLPILTAVKAIWGERVTTVFPKQGRYANDATTLRQNPPADITIERISDIVALDRSALTPTSHQRAANTRLSATSRSA
jgi:hypothetical protein